ncbi:MAG: hypothetical protein J4O04_01020 [Chloroflexi bacterium]|nr:hypothetical protein [Chloroflexota bacterium]
MPCPRRFYALALPALASMLLACGIGVASGPPPTTTPTHTPAGFLPTFTPTVGATAERLDVGVGRCPPFPEIACTRVDETANLFDGLPLDKVQALLYVEDGGGGWVLERSADQNVLQQLDRDVSPEPYDIEAGPYLYEGIGGRGPRGEALVLYWPEGEGVPDGNRTMDRVDFAIDRGRGLMGHVFIRLQWSVPPEFFDALISSFSNVTPTPSPTNTPLPTPTPTITVQPSTFFDHPEGELLWDGADDRVSTSRPEPDGHCYFDHPPFGLPRLIKYGDGVSRLLLSGPRPVPSEDSWRWTGYYRGKWQIWQGDEPLTAYIVNTLDPGYAFEYRRMSCF